MSENHEKASYRDHPLRGIQNRLEGQIPGIMFHLYRNGLLADTGIEKTISRGEIILPDDLTLAGLEFTVQASKAQVETNLDLALLGRFFLGALMNASDGAHARHLHLDSPEGAVKDVLADRISDNFMAIMIAKYRKKYREYPCDLEINLRTAFQLSTLMKAACEMSAVHTSEGGQGSMIERRQKLFLTLLNLGKLNQHNESSRLSLKKEQVLLQNIDKRNQLLIDNSYDRAIKRGGALSKAYAENPNLWENPALNNPHSSAAVEARKYVAVIELNQMTGLTDIEQYLNSFVVGVRFPKAAELKTKYPYIANSLEQTRSFFNSSIAIANSNLE